MPAKTGAPLSRRSRPDLAACAVGQGIAAGISASTIRRILAADAIKPWQYRSWLFTRDPDFAVKAGRVLDLYSRVWDGNPLGDDAYVISPDEKTSIQARCRCHPTLPPGTSRTMRVNHDYDHGGALAYLAARDARRARVIGFCSDTTGIEPFTDLVDEVMTQEPYASARRVYRVVGNGPSRPGQAAIDRLAARYPHAVMVHTPVHASWLNQVEIFFSILQRKVVTPNDFTDLDQVQDRLTAFEHHYNQTATPFCWKFTRADLKGTAGPDRTARTKEHDIQHDPPAAAPRTPEDSRRRPLSGIVL